MVCHPLQVAAKELLRRLTLTVDVDLLFIKGTPYLFLTAICKMGDDIGCSRFSLIDLVHLFLGGLPAFPEIFVADKQIVPL